MQHTDTHTQGSYTNIYTHTHTLIYTSGIIYYVELAIMFLLFSHIFHLFLMLIIEKEI